MVYPRLQLYGKQFKSLLRTEKIWIDCWYDTSKMIRLWQKLKCNRQKFKAYTELYIHYGSIMTNNSRGITNNITTHMYVQYKMQSKDEEISLVRCGDRRIQTEETGETNNQGKSLPSISLVSFSLLYPFLSPTYSTITAFFSMRKQITN